MKSSNFHYELVAMRSLAKRNYTELPHNSLAFVETSTVHSIERCCCLLAIPGAENVRPKPSAQHSTAQHSPMAWLCSPSKHSHFTGIGSPAKSQSLATSVHCSALPHLSGMSWVSKRRRGAPSCAVDTGTKPSTRRRPRKELCHPDGRRGGPAAKV